MAVPGKDEREAGSLPTARLAINVWTGQLDENAQDTTDLHLKAEQPFFPDAAKPQTSIQTCVLIARLAVSR